MTNYKIKDIRNCIHFMFEEWEEYTDEGATYILENMTCLHPDREDTNGECEFLDGGKCAFFEEENV